MAWRPHGKAQVDPSHPSAFGICDRDGMLYNLRDLFWQYDWRGNKLTNLRIRVCRNCLDKPQQQLRPVILPPDPVPVKDPRPETGGQEIPPQANAGPSPGNNGYLIPE